MKYRKATETMLQASKEPANHSLVVPYAPSTQTLQRTRNPTSSLSCNSRATTRVISTAINNPIIAPSISNQSANPRQYLNHRSLRLSHINRREVEILPPGQYHPPNPTQQAQLHSTNSTCTNPRHQSQSTRDSMNSTSDHGRSSSTTDDV